MAAAEVMRQTMPPHALPGSSGRPIAVLGRDPRASGEFLAAAMMAGLASAGMDVLDVGVLPTPAVAFLTAQLGADLGVMLSASHNPAADNGIKLFAAGGRKLSDATEDAIQARMEQTDLPYQRPIGEGVGRIQVVLDAQQRYVSHLLSTIDNRLAGLTVVLDCAHGAASTVAPQLLEQAGATVVTIGNQPDGLNINQGCGSTHLQRLQEAVRDHRADVGIAHDGDADRCLAVDAQGEIVDGDQIMAILAVAMKERGQLRSNTLVATVMSNLGLSLAMKREGIELVTTQVGDRYVLEAMLAQGHNLGGEQSGHVVMLDWATTGDGLLTALQLLSRMAHTNRPLAQLATVMQRLPQVLINVPEVDKARVGSNEAVQQAVRQAQNSLGEQGRVLLRASGTEPLVRVMVEASQPDQAQAVAQELADVVRHELSLHQPVGV